MNVTFVVGEEFLPDFGSICEGMLQHLLQPLLGGQIFKDHVDSGSSFLEIFLHGEVGDGEAVDDQIKLLLGVFNLVADLFHRFDLLFGVGLFTPHILSVINIISQSNAINLKQHEGTFWIFSHCTKPWMED